MDIRVTRLHVLIYGTSDFTKCMFCTKPLTKKLNAIRCEDCFNTYVRLYNDLRCRGYDTNAIKSFVYDMDDKKMLQISASTPEYQYPFSEVFSFEP